METLTAALLMDSPKTPSNRPFNSESLGFRVSGLGLRVILNPKREAQNTPESGEAPEEMPAALRCNWGAL